MKPRVLLVEDDHLQVDFVRQALEEGLGVEVELKSTEWEFQRDFESIAANPPAVAVLDVMLRWATPSRDMPQAPYGQEEFKAGLRCAKRLQSDPRTGQVKVLLYTVLGEEDFDADAPLVITKEADTTNLVEGVRRLLGCG